MDPKADAANLDIKASDVSLDPKADAANLHIKSGDVSLDANAGVVHTHDLDSIKGKPAPVLPPKTIIKF